MSGFITYHSPPLPAVAPPHRASAASSAARARQCAPARWPAAAACWCVRRAAGPVAATAAAAGVPALSAASQEGVLSVAVVGDLHLEPGPQMDLFRDARTHLRGALCDATTGAPYRDACVVQLGDLGAYAAKPGSQACFDLAKDYLSGFSPVPFSLVTGNHDLEGFDDFATDAENLAAWQRTFGQHHFWARPAGRHLLIGLSTVRFRDAPGSCHEVFIDEQQLAWFERTLAENRHLPTLVFSHAPPMGSGLRALPAVHVKNRCAWLNHGEANPQRFAQIAAVNPQIKLWFSGHFHLSHDYADSVSTCGECTFVQTGVIGATSSRDGRRHSRLVRASPTGFQLYTVDHNAHGALRLDMARTYDGSAPTFVNPASEERVKCDPKSGWFVAQDACELPAPAAAAAAASASVSSPWLYTGATELTVQEGALVEYDSLTRAPLGVVVRKIAPGSRVRLLDSSGRDAEGASAVAVEVVAPDGGGRDVVERVQRGANGRFYQTFQENKYKKWLKARAAEAVAAA